MMMGDKSEKFPLDFGNSEAADDQEEKWLWWKKGVERQMVLDKV